MRTLTMRMRQWGRAKRAMTLGVLFAGAVTVSACDDFLSASNPSVIQADQLGDTALVDLMQNSAIGAFQDVYPWLSYYGAVFTDELRNHHVFFEEGLIDQRRVQSDNGTISFFHYTPMQRARWLADSVAGRMRALYADSSRRDIRLARAYAYAGYGLIMLGEMWCEVPLSSAGVRYSRPYTSDELFTFAQQRFDSVIAVATASRAANAAVTSGVNAALAARYVLAADSLIRLANLGKARAALNKNDLPNAIAFAQQVTAMPGQADWEFRLHYNATTTLGVFNFYQDRLSGGAGVTTGSLNNTPFLALDDPRVPHPMTAAGAPQPEATMGGSFIVPNSPPSFSTYNGTRTGADFTYGASIRLASLLEANYIIAEARASAPTAADIAFVESRRTAFPSTTAATPTTAANFFTNLIDQRRRDFYLDGHRTGDLRRWARFRSTNLWPTGAYPVGTATYGTNMCWPINVAEITNNPLVPKPYTPPQGP